MAKAMKAMKAMKKKAVSKIARGIMSKAMVLRGSKEKTVGGLSAKDLTRNKAGKIVSKKQSALFLEEVQADRWAMDAGCGKGAQSLEDYRLLCDQEGYTFLREGQGVLQRVSAALT